jgi:hypothetical protein
LSFAAGINLVVLAGAQEAPTPLGPVLTDLIESVEVTQNADGQSGFRITFGAQRGSNGMGSDNEVMNDPRIAPLERVVICVTSGLVPTTLIDGLITDIWLDPGKFPDDARVVISGADLSVAMDMTESITAYPAENEALIAERIIAKYARFELIPEVVPPIEMVTPLPTQFLPMQYGTDLTFLYEMADRFGYVFNVRPGPVPLTNIAYFGPPVRLASMLPALSVATGSLGNVNEVAFSYDGLAASSVSALIQDPIENETLPVFAMEPTLPPLARSSPFLSPTSVRQRLLRQADGLNLLQANALAQGIVNRSATRIVRAEGEVNTLAYGEFLLAGLLIGVRGAGSTFDGTYAIDSVTHTLREGEYLQRFRLTREGVGSLEPAVLP